MSTEVKLRRGTSTEHETFTGALAELTVDSTATELRLHDGATVGGVAMAKKAQLVAAEQSVATLQQQLSTVPTETAALLGEHNTDASAHPTLVALVASEAASLRSELATLSGGVVGYADLSVMQADVLQSAGTVGKVLNDPTQNNNGEYLWDGSSWTKSSYDLTGRLEADIAVNASNISRTRGERAELSSANLFDKAQSEEGYLSSDVANFVPDINSATSSYIPVEQLTDYFLSGRTLGTTTVIAFYDEGKNILPPSFGATYEDAPLNGLCTSPVSAAYIRFTVVFNNTGTQRAVQLEKGSTASNYSVYKQVIPLSQSRSIPDNNPIFDQRRNLFDRKSMVVTDKLISNGDGAEVEAAGWAYAEIPYTSSYPYVSIDMGISDVSATDDTISFYSSGFTRIGYSSVLQNIQVPEGTTIIRFNIASSEGNVESAKNSVLVELAQDTGEYVGYSQQATIQRKYIPEKTMSGVIVSWVGDSIVRANTGYEGWVSLISRKYGAVGINRGDHGATIANIYPSAACMSGNLLTYQYDSATDLTIFSGGTNDFGNSLPLGDSADMLGSVDTTVKGSLYKAIQWVKDNNPESSILVTTPLERSTNETNGLGLFLKDYRDAIIEVCEAHAVPYIDLMYNNLISLPTAYKYLHDGLHPNSEGYIVSLSAMEDQLKSYVT